VMVLYLTPNLLLQTAYFCCDRSLPIHSDEFLAVVVDAALEQLSLSIESLEVRFEILT
jgi:hypothetical protein